MIAVMLMSIGMMISSRLIQYIPSLSVYTTGMVYTLLLKVEFSRRCKYVPSKIIDKLNILYYNISTNITFILALAIQILL